MTTTVVALHTGFALVEPLRPLFAEILAGVRIVNVVDDSLLADVRAAGGLTPAVTRRILGYGMLAQDSGASAVFNCCSSVGDAADMLARTLDIPVVRIDDRMAGEAVRCGSRIAVVATLATTLDPTQRLIERKACYADRTVAVRPYLAAEAFDALMSGDAALHDRLVESAVQDAAQNADVVVLAQGSMARLVPRLAGRISTPVLSSPRLGVEALREVLSAAARG